MLRALEIKLVPPGLVRRLAFMGLLAVSGALAPAVLRARRKAAKRPVDVEVARLEIGDGCVGAVYEDGRLIGVLEGVDRL